MYPHYVWFVFPSMFITYITPYRSSLYPIPRLPLHIFPCRTAPTIPSPFLRYPLCYRYSFVPLRTVLKDAKPQVERTKKKKVTAGGRPFN